VQSDFPARERDKSAASKRHYRENVVRADARSRQITRIRLSGAGARKYVTDWLGQGDFRSTPQTEAEQMKSPSKRAAEPSIVVDPSLAAPAWTSEETVVFHREMLQDMNLAVSEMGKQALPAAKPKQPSLRPALILSAFLILGAVALRLWLYR
jgi:hypothetical protein